MRYKCKSMTQKYQSRFSLFQFFNSEKGKEATNFIILSIGSLPVKVEHRITKMHMPGREPFF